MVWDGWRGGWRRCAYINLKKKLRRLQQHDHSVSSVHHELTLLLGAAVPLQPGEPVDELPEDLSGCRDDVPVQLPSRDDAAHQVLVEVLRDGAVEVFDVHCDVANGLV